MLTIEQARAQIELQGYSPQQVERMARIWAGVAKPVSSAKPANKGKVRLRTAVNGTLDRRTATAIRIWAQETTGEKLLSVTGRVPKVHRANWSQLTVSTRRKYLKLADKYLKSHKH